MIVSLVSRGDGCQYLSHLLHKHPARVHQTNLPFGLARVFYPKYTEQECCAVLAVEMNNVEAVRGRADWALGQYVNDRPYSASSLLCTAISKVFRSAVAGNCAQKPHLTSLEFDLEFRLPAVKAELDGCLSLFEPLGYHIKTAQGRRETTAAPWEEEICLDISGRKTTSLRDLLRHLLVLIPVMDKNKHYWVGDDEVGKLVSYGEGWLENHPQRDLITRCYLKNQGKLVRQASERIHGGEGSRWPKRDLHAVRLNAVLEKIVESKPSSVIDLGCGEGKLLIKMLEQTQIPKVSGMDISLRSLRSLSGKFDKEWSGHKNRADIFFGSLLYKDSRLGGYDVATLVEVIEHIELERIGDMEKSVFGAARPKMVIVTTPNRDYNCLLGSVGEGFRHAGHRFEWSRKEFSEWAGKISSEYGYSFYIEGVGDEHPEHWTPSQLAVFRAL